MNGQVAEQQIQMLAFQPTTIDYMTKDYLTKDYLTKDYANELRKIIHLHI